MARVWAGIVAIGIAAIFLGPLHHAAVHFALAALRAAVIGVAVALGTAVLGTLAFGLFIWMTKRRAARHAPPVASCATEPVDTSPAAPLPADMCEAGDSAPKPPSIDHLAARGIRLEWDQAPSPGKARPSAARVRPLRRVPLEFRD